MRWGVRNEASNDHSASWLCMRELETCQKISNGPCFVVCNMNTTFNYLLLNAAIILILILTWLYSFINTTTIL